MITAKKKAVELTLGQRIDAIRDEMEAFLDAKVAALKASSDGALQPVADLRHMITRGDSCLCRIVERLIEESSK
jgi:hypothetical protein